MPPVEYAYSDLRSSMIRDNEHGPAWTYRSARIPPSERALEEEIDLLRRIMVQLFNQDHALTSEAVIEISRLLDIKINEYMDLLERQRRGG